VDLLHRTSAQVGVGEEVGARGRSPARSAENAADDCWRDDQQVVVFASLIGG
jgi:hypothetical protein